MKNSKNNKFYSTQTRLTAAKIKVYKKYIQSYLPKLLMTFGSCLIADLFCGAGKNGTKNGSPLVLIDRANYILSSDIIKQKNAKIEILFNDQDCENIDNLRAELQKTETDRNIHITTQCEKFEDYFSELIQSNQPVDIPKFFFLIHILIQM